MPEEFIYPPNYEREMNPDWDPQEGKEYIVVRPIDNTGVGLEVEGNFEELVHEIDITCPNSGDSYRGLLQAAGPVESILLVPKTAAMMTGRVRAYRPR